MHPSPISYDEPLFRPPSEARSLILQVTLGCSWNRCTFCEMYKSKRFHIRSREEIDREIDWAAQALPDIKRIFLADGDALAMQSEDLLWILTRLREAFPELQRVSAYALPRNIRKKRDAELAQMRGLGLQLVYLGIESGDDEVLKKVDKGETAETTARALERFAQAGIKTSVMVLNGLGGTELWQDHAVHSAEVVNRAQPDYLATLVVTFPLGMERMRFSFPGYQLPEQNLLFSELELFLSHLDLHKTIFRSDHASNYLALKGVLNRDKQKLLNTLRQAIDHPEKMPLRQEWQRGL